MICGVVVIAAVVLAYWPTQGWYADLAARVDKSIASGAQIAAILKKERHLPNLSLDSNATPEELQTFPTPEVHDIGAKAVGALGTQSTALLNLAIQVNTHLPLVPNALPAGGPIDRSQFASVFVTAVEGDARIRAWPTPYVKQASNLTYPIPDLNAGQTPTTDEVAQLTQKINDQWKLENPTGAVNGNQALLNQEIAQGVANLDNEDATKCKVYLEPGAITQSAVYAAAKAAVAPLPASELWQGQLWMWIVEDAATAVARANKDATNVLDSPVKQITSLVVKDPPYLIVGDPTQGSDTVPLTPTLDASPTGRVSNGMYDVTQFSMGLDVDADKLPDLLKNLESGQFLTIVSATCTALDSAHMLKGHFIYGKARMVHVDLIFEDIFLHTPPTLAGGYSQLCPPNCGPAGIAGAGNGGGGGGGPGAGAASMLNVTTHAQ
jgi:hypothetical protein